MVIKRYVSKRERRKRIIIAVGSFFVLLVLFTALMFTGIGKKIVKSYLESKIDKYVPSAKITYIDYGFNTFSVDIKENGNILKVYGTVFPLNAIFEGNIKNLATFTPYRGSMKLNGKIFKKDGEYHINGVSYAADGYANFKAVPGRFAFYADGHDFDIKKLLYMLKIKNDFLSGKTDVVINKNSAVYKIKLVSEGKYESSVKTAFKAVSFIDLKDKRNFDFKSDIDSDLGKLNIKGERDPKGYIIDIDAKDLNLALLRSYLLYPFRGDINLQGVYNSVNGIFKFKNDNIEGFYDGKLEVTFKIDDKQFFTYVGMKRFFEGYITGIIKIRDGLGSFDMVSNHTKISDTGLTSRIKNLCGIDLSKEKISKVFYKGVFDNQKVVFDILSNNDGLFLSVNRGMVFYNGTYDFNMTLRKNGEIYLFNVKDGKVKLIKRKNVKKGSNKVLVY